ncbi:glutamyl-tRNA reductase [Thermodesulfovibrio yellowstonii]|uniref:Glutamyl-tRNA reductase n=1 Tax=Thermodesulfovibrio yellowstonii (strain ATCC 51303 / DSM 11347 / YP87) TaxID=289376 RepID=HEM1_THEYD|nr:glutamyl-tRNA reductase [Thermodesulfovibrio yellowstonii]B5YJZ3.1 RecName: Full=Glutamyl-tRNA reductase; Short=GluTR [Thermodesulfovibrio yellowstonii DSM 11347]ACI21817.1 glutamyl-tRNA reductase [Thermodesulfovibrio yellowstonii DSM 11347]
MSLIVIGLNHKTAPVEIREKIAFNSKEAIKEALKELIQREGIGEVVIISTCNRVEIYVYTANVSDLKRENQVEETIKAFLSNFHNIEIGEFENYLYVYKDTEAVEHLFKVASSLDSMIVGEPQITGQVKESYEIALSERTTSLILNYLMNRALFTAKRVRNETRIGENPVSVSYAAVGLIKKVFDELSKKSILLVGAGEMAELALRHLIGSGIKNVYLTNRTFQRAEEIAKEFNGVAVPFGNLKEQLVKTDIVICSTGAPHYVITEQMLKEVMPLRKHKPIFFIDISVPRNVDPACNELDNVYLYNIDDLQDVVDSNILERKKEAEKALSIVQEETEKFFQWLNSLESVPVIVSIRNKAEQVRQEEIEKFKAKYKDLPPELINSIDYLTQSIINKIMHSPTVALKNNCENKEILIFSARRLFGLDSEEE